jgi:pimeloyl-ACP methyl ester carboxylesterase
MKDLILLHGALGHSGHFDALAEKLSPHFKVHTFDFIGHGASPLSDEPLTIDTYVQQLQAYCDRMQLQQPYIFGYSMGGYVALCYAARNPGGIGSVLTLATKFAWTPEGAAREAQMLQPDKIMEKVPQFAQQLAAMHGSEKWRLLLPEVAHLMQKLGDRPLLQATELQAISAPVQLMVGDRDAMVTLEETKETAKLLPNARWAVLPGTKHPLEQVRSALLLHLMLDFWL